MNVERREEEGQRKLDREIEIVMLSQLEGTTKELMRTIPHRVVHMMFDWPYDDDNNIGNVDGRSIQDDDSTNGWSTSTFRYYRVLLHTANVFIRTF